MAHDQEVAGIRCMEVLGKLDAYVDGELAVEEVRQINAHLEGCSWCEQFGGRYARMVELLRTNLHQEERALEATKLAAHLLEQARGTD